MLEGLRVVREDPNVGALLRVVVLGGSALRDMLLRDVSPFLRAACWLPVHGLELAECASLVREPLAAAVDDATLEALWRETGGHPQLVQRILSRAVVQAWPSRGSPLDVIPAVEAQQGTLFEILWRNLRSEGQRAYLELMERGPLQSVARLARIGNNPAATLEVLTSTGVARVDASETTHIHGEMFARWVRANIAPVHADMTRETRQRLREVCARLIDRPSAIRMIADDVGLRPEHIDFTGAADGIWHAVITEAAKQRRLASLYEQVRRRYESDPDLAALASHLVDV